MGKSELEYISRVLRKEPVFWKNPEKTAAAEALEKAEEKFGLGFNEIKDAENRLLKFAPFLKKAFPDTADGIIESELKAAFSFSKEVLCLENNFYIKCDNSLPVAGSIKARGGIYEILKFAESLAFENNMITEDSDYSAFASLKMNELFSKYHVAVGSTGNLGMSIGIISAKLGFRVTIHMSKDAKEWKKNKLRSLGVNVIEHSGSYAEAVEEGRKECEKDPWSYFVDDENSKELFLGYSVAALRLEKQLKEQGITVDKYNALFVYLPCGVGGAPGGISFGLKHVFGDNVKCYFAEPVNAPSVLLGFIEKRKINFKEYNFKMETDADGLAVDSPSELVLDICTALIDGIYTISDEVMYRDLFSLKVLEDEKIEVSAAASLHGPSATLNSSKKGTHIAWLTGGLFVPENEYKMMFETGRGHS
jgi:D-serine dehydratase